MAFFFCLFGQQIEHRHDAGGIVLATLDLHQVMRERVQGMVGHIAGGTEIAFVGIVDPFAKIVIGDGLGDQEMQIGITLAMGLRDHVHREAVHGDIYIGAVVRVETAEEELQNGDADLIGFGRNFLANPDFVERIVAGAALNEVDFTTLYSPGEKGYTDYPTMTA